MINRWNPEGCPTSVLDMVPPGVGPAGRSSRASQPDPKASSGVIGGVPKEDFIQRVQQLAGPLNAYGRAPALEVYEEIFRIEPNESWFDPNRSQSNPTQFELASISADTGRWIFVFDYSIRPFGFSGIAIGDVMPMPEGYMSGSFGYAIRIGGRPAGIVRYRLNPTSPALRKQRFGFNQSKFQQLANMTQDDFSRTRANSFASASGFGGEIHPQAPGRFGATNVPFMLSVGDGLPVEITGVLFNEVTLPVAFIETRISGYITSAVLAHKLLSELELTTR